MASEIGEDILRLVFECFDEIPAEDSQRPLSVDVRCIHRRYAFFFNCTLTSRFFCQSSLPFLYRIIAVDQLSSQRKLAMLELLRDPLKKYGHYVRWFTTGGIGLGGFDVVRELLPLLPNVKVLNICRTLSGLQRILRSTKHLERLAFGIEGDAERRSLVNHIMRSRLVQPGIAISSCTTLELDWTIIDSQILRILDMFRNVRYLTFGSSCKYRTDFLPVSTAEMDEELAVAEKVFFRLDRLTFGMVRSDTLHILLPLCSNIKALDIRFVRLISKDTIRILAAHCNHLQQFWFYTSSIDKEAIEELILRPPVQLQTLSMKYLSYNVTGTLLEMVSAYSAAPISSKLNSISLFGMVPPSLDALMALSILLPNLRYLGFIMKIDYSAQELGRALAGFKHLTGVYIRRPLFSEASTSTRVAEHEQLVRDLADLLPNVDAIECFELCLRRRRNGADTCVTKTLQLKTESDRI